MRSFLRLGLTSASLTLVVSASHLHAQGTQQATPIIAVTIGAPTPDSLAHLVLARFASGTPAAFDSVYPDPLGREVQHSAVQHHESRRADDARVLWRNSRRAVLLLTATVGTGSGSDQTNAVRRFSGLYEAQHATGQWVLTRQLPLDTANYFLGQILHVTLVPGDGIHVLDTLALKIGSPYGFAARLNNAVKFASVQLDGRPVEYTLGGGVLFLKSTPPTRAHARSQLVLDYTLAESRTPAEKAAEKTTEAARSDTGSATIRSALPPYGAFYNSDAWHPFFMYDAEHDLEPFTVTVRLPAAYRLTTTLPQVESVASDIRTVVGRSVQPVSIVGLMYDRDWRVEKTEGAGLQFESFVTPQFRFSHDSLAAVAHRVYAVMVPRFGLPQVSANYLGEVETRLLHGQGMGPRMNYVVTSGDALTQLAAVDTIAPSFLFAHEMVHGWTLDATSLAANFLREGWATYAESLILRAVGGAKVYDVFWERERTMYATGLDRSGYFGGFEGRQSILGNPDNGRIHYQKGSWVFHSLEYVLGDAAFNRAMREFIHARRPGVPAGYREFIAAMSHAAGRDMTGFIMPWLTGKYIPDVEARIDRQRVIVTQNQPDVVFDLPLELALKTAAGTVRRPIHLVHRADTLNTRDLGAVTDVRVDPDHHFLLQRHYGEVVRFELSASMVPDAGIVELAGDFAPKPIPAVRTDDKWVVELPMSEGRYVYAWRIDGVMRGPSGAVVSSAPPYGVRVVRPLERVTGAYPR